MIRTLFLALLLTACGTASQPGAAPGEAALAISPERPQPGQSLTLMLTNRSTDGIGYNLCTSELVREEASGWVPVPTDRICTMELRLLNPEEEATFDLDLPPDLPPGTYRFETRVELTGTGGMDTLSTPPFEL